MAGDAHAVGGIGLLVGGDKIWVWESDGVGEVVGGSSGEFSPQSTDGTVVMHVKGRGKCYRPCRKGRQDSIYKTCSI